MSLFTFCKTIPHLLPGSVSVMLPHNTNKGLPVIAGVLDVGGCEVTCVILKINTND